MLVPRRISAPPPVFVNPPAPLITLLLIVSDVPSMLKMLTPLVRMTGPTTMLLPLSFHKVALFLRTTRLFNGAVFRFQSSSVAPGETAIARAGSPTCDVAVWIANTPSFTSISPRPRSTETATSETWLEPILVILTGWFEVASEQPLVEDDEEAR